ncbi:MAG: GNAT family N-acetyltransferase [Acidocella sp. 20-57-95]|nr:MAG: GNAT family N-acetyltransferase [Acidocella sp. 20-57-95]OYV60320.1 MAG: GNAT family N-acetyltransferase [Acidocella sp. 21-58-7]HQT63447.1 GNAT family N-acetyltransferase [Acidocella sp.]HQU04775.1 GNAT family N-acetyltransferase [Acidocella sp.]
MRDDPSKFTLELYPAIAEIGQVAWDRCAGDDNPFVSYGFLSALEDSGSVGKRSGWFPRYAALKNTLGEVVAVAPAYAKTNSYGEYVFDHGWANAFEQGGGQYYPKLQVAVPFSPVPGPRLLCRPDFPAEAVGDALIKMAQTLDCSSVHITFCSEAEWALLGKAGWLQRLGTQFHWDNQGYRNFDDFLAALSSRKRKAIKRERRDAAQGLTFKALSGADLTPAVWDAFYQFYLSTVDRKWGGVYLTRAFFDLLGERLGEEVVLMMAERDGKPIAGALNLRGREALYGRNWGSIEDVPFLHFELCYYQAIDYAIAHGLKRVEAGAQGEHKIQRGYTPKPTYSAHWIFHRGLSDAVAKFLAAERPAILRAMAELDEDSPYKKLGDAA